MADNMVSLYQALKILHGEIQGGTLDPQWLLDAIEYLEQGIEEQKMLLRDIEAWARMKSPFSYAEGASSSESIRKRVHEFLYPKSQEWSARTDGTVESPSGIVFPGDTMKLHTTVVEGTIDDKGISTLY